MSARVSRWPVSLLRRPRRIRVLVCRAILRRRICVGFLRLAGQRHSRADSQRDQQPTDLESQFHLTLHLLILLACIVCLHRRRQFRQHVEIRQHVVILQHGNIVLRNLLLIGAGIHPNPHARQHQH